MSARSPGPTPRSELESGTSRSYPTDGPDEYGEDAGERDHLLVAPDAKFLADRALVAHSNMRAMTIGMILCFTLFVLLQTARLSLEATVKWPLYIDFMPLWILPVLMYIAVADFAATRLSPEAILGKAVVVVSGFVYSAAILSLSVFVCLRITHAVEWPWMYVLLPFWVMMAFAQFFLCFLIPGFLRADKLQAFMAIVISVWALAFFALLTSLRLDNEIETKWWIIFIPVWLTIISQIALTEKTTLDLVGLLCALWTAIWVPLRADDTLKMPWLLILLPSVLVLVAAVYQISFVDRGEE